MQNLQYRASDFTSSIGNVSSVEWAAINCDICRVSSIEQAVIQVVLGRWSGTEVVVIDAASPA